MKISILKGKHSCTFNTRLKFFPWVAFNVRELKLTVKVTGSMFVWHANEVCRYDSNKIFGISDGIFTNHHKDSYRISYVVHKRGTKLRDADCIQFLYYNYVNGEKQSNFLPGLYMLGDTATISHKLPKAVTGRKLMPYHGGNCAATRNVFFDAKIEYL